MFVTFEGIEGSGKSTLIEQVRSQADIFGAPVMATREPGGTPFGDALRAVFLDPTMKIDPVAEVFLVNASRAQLVKDVIRPALQRNEIVLCDRFFDATVAYQGFGRGLDVEILLELCLSATQRLAPDLTFVLDIPVELAFERLRSRQSRTGTGADRMESENLEFHERVRRGYLTLASRFTRIVVLDALAPPAELALRAVDEIVHHRVHHR